MPRAAWLLLAAIAPILWGGMYAFSRILMKTANPFALGEVRLILAEALYVVMSFATQGKSKMTWKDMGYVALLGAMGYGGTSGFQLYGTFLTSAHFAALVLSLTPLLLLVAMRVLLGAPVSKAAMWMSGASMVGLIVSVRPWATIHATNPIGLLVLLVSGVCWVLYSTYIQRFMVKYNPWDVMKFSTVGGLVALLVPSWSKLHTIYPVLDSLSGVMLILYVGILSTGVAYICWNLSIRLVGPELPALFYFFQPLVATLLGIVVLRERLTMAFDIGAIEMLTCVSLGVYFQRRYRRSRASSTVSSFQEG